EAGDLLLPFGFDGSGRHDENPPDALFPRQYLAGGDGLRGLAEPHLVGQERAFVEGQMRRALTLIGEKRQFDDIETVTAPVTGPVGPGHEILAGLLARGEPPFAVDPRAEMTRDPDDRRSLGRGVEKARNGLEVGEERSVLAEEGVEKRARLGAQSR